MDKEFYTQLTEEAISLLEEKGFRGSISIDQIFARMLSEVGELINAYKKGFSKEEQEDELADVVIYLCNIIDKAGIVGEVEAKWWEYFIEDGMTSEFKKLATMNAWKAMTMISYAISSLEIITVENESVNEDTATKPSYVLYVNEVLAACENCADILDLDLEEGIKRKMAKNWNRPYRYNTASEHFIG